MSTRKRNPTIREVAKLAKVGIMTVSRVLNGYDSVRASTRKKVEAAIDQLGYHRNEAASLLKGQRSKVIGLIVPDLSDIFFASCAHTVQEIAWQHGYMTLVVSSNRDPERELQQAEMMARRMIAGLLVVSSVTEKNDRMRHLQESGLPVVAFDRPLAGLNTDAVLVENREGAKEAVRHLVDHGHTKIACLGYDEAAYTIHERIDGYKQVMHERRLKPNVVEGKLSLAEVIEWLDVTLASKNRPTAIFTLNHRASTNLIQALHLRRVRVPEDMALVGFDDFDLAALVRPALTTVSQSPVDLARRSMQLLLKHVVQKPGEPADPPAKIMLPTTLIVRESCGGHKRSEH